MDPTCIICAECFENSDHTGHRVIPKYSVSGCCDCGDLDAWSEVYTLFSKAVAKITKVTWLRIFKNILRNYKKIMKKNN